MSHLIVKKESNDTRPGNKPKPDYVIICIRNCSRHTSKVIKEKGVQAPYVTYLISLFCAVTFLGVFAVLFLAVFGFFDK